MLNKGKLYRIIKAIFTIENITYLFLFLGINHLCKKVYLSDFLFNNYIFLREEWNNLNWVDLFGSGVDTIKTTKLLVYNAIVTLIGLLGFKKKSWLKLIIINSVILTSATTLNYLGCFVNTFEFWGGI